MIGFEQERPLTSFSQFQDFMARSDALGFTDLVFHAPRRDDPARTTRRTSSRRSRPGSRARQERPRTS